MRARLAERLGVGLDRVAQGEDARARRRGGRGAGGGVSGGGAGGGSGGRLNPRTVPHLAAKPARSADPDGLAASRPVPIASMPRGPRSRIPDAPRTPVSRPSAVLCLAIGVAASGLVLGGCASNADKKNQHDRWVADADANWNHIRSHALLGNRDQGVPERPARPGRAHRLRRGQEGPDQPRAVPARRPPAPWRRASWRRPTRSSPRRSCSPRPARPSPAATVLLPGRNLQRWQRPEEALERYTVAHRIEPDNPGRLLAMTETMIAIGRLDEAKKELSDRLSYFDQHPALRVTLAHIEKMQGNQAERFSRVQGGRAAGAAGHGGPRAARRSAPRRRKHRRRLRRHASTRPRPRLRPPRRPPPPPRGRRARGRPRRRRPPALHRPDRQPPRQRVRLDRAGRAVVADAGPGRHADRRQPDHGAGAQRGQRLPDGRARVAVPRRDPRRAAPLRPGRRAGPARRHAGADAGPDAPEGRAAGPPPATPTPRRWSGTPPTPASRGCTRRPRPRRPPRRRVRSPRCPRPRTDAHSAQAPPRTFPSAPPAPVRPHRHARKHPPRGLCCGPLRPPPPPPLPSWRTRCR